MRHWPDKEERPWHARAFLTRAKDLPGADPDKDPGLEARLAWVAPSCPACNKPHIFPFRSVWDTPGTKSTTIWSCEQKDRMLDLEDADPVRTQRIFRDAEPAREALLMRAAARAESEYLPRRQD